MSPTARGLSHPLAEWRSVERRVFDLLPQPVLSGKRLVCAPLWCPGSGRRRGWRVYTALRFEVYPVAVQLKGARGRRSSPT